MGLSAKCACLSEKSSGTAPVAFVVPLATSAMANSLPAGRSMRALNDPVDLGHHSASLAGLLKSTKSPKFR